MYLPLLICSGPYLLFFILQPLPFCPPPSSFSSLLWPPPLSLPPSTGWGVCVGGCLGGGGGFGEGDGVHPLWASTDMERPRALEVNSMRMGLTGGRSRVISSTVLLMGQVTGVKSRRPSSSTAVCAAHPRPSRTPSSDGVKIGRGRVFLLGRSWCSRPPCSTMPSRKTPEGQACPRVRSCHCWYRVSLRESSFMSRVCLWAEAKRAWVRNTFMELLPQRTVTPFLYIRMLSN